MKIIITGVEYDLYSSINKAALGDLIMLKSKLNVSVKTINETFKKFGKLSDVEMLDDMDAMQNMQGVIWLAQRKAGEDGTLDDAGLVSYSDVEFDDESTDAAEDVEPDPKAPTASGQGVSGASPRS